MRVVTFRGEASVNAIADRVYADLTPESRKKAVAALIRENPQLATLDRVNPGTVLAVPEVPGVRRTPGRGQEGPVDEIGDILSQALQDYGKRMAAHHDEFEAEVKEQRKLLRDRALRRAIRESAPAAELVERAGKSIAADAKAAEENRERLESAIEKLRADLSASGR